MYNKLILIFCGLTASFLTLGCKNYSVSVNEKVVYTPPSVFKDYQLADSKLKDCVEQTIYDLHISSAEELTRLNCSNAGISSLIGLDKFFALKELNLADNQLVDVSVIGSLGRLEKLELTNNNIRNAEPFLHLLHLQQLNLENNPDLDCKLLDQLTKNLSIQQAELHFPTHCKK
jgi:hypothetical protein